MELRGKTFGEREKLSDDIFRKDKFHQNSKFQPKQNGLSQNFFFDYVKKTMCGVSLSVVAAQVAHGSYKPGFESRLSHFIAAYRLNFDSHLTHCFCVPANFSVEISAKEHLYDHLALEYVISV